MRFYYIHLLIFSFFAVFQTHAQSFFDDSLAVQQMVNSENVKRNSVYTLNRVKQKPPARIQIPGSYQITFKDDSIQIKYQIPGDPSGVASLTLPSDIFLLSGLDKKELTEDFIARVNHRDTENTQPLAKDSTALLQSLSSFHPDTVQTHPHIPQLGIYFNTLTQAEQTFGDKAAKILGDFAGSDQKDTLEFTLRTYGFKKVTLNTSPDRIFNALPYAPFNITAGRDDKGAALFLEHDFFNFGHMFFVHYTGENAGTIDCLMYIPVDDIEKTMKTYNPPNTNE